ncbi:MAG: hypothetical protein ONB05_00090 [candidate division KSB1 bacterium]|nr:hypothetical protein [candidate division KSB1 bacterium]
MKNIIVIGATLTALILTSGVSSTQAQGIGSIVERLNKLEKRLDRLEAIQKKNQDNYNQLDKRELISGIDSSLSSLALRMNRLEANIEEIKKTELGEEAETISGLTVDLRELVGELRSVISETASKDKDKEKVSKYPINLYGYIKLDACYDASRISSGNFVRWVESNGKKDDQFNLTARQTRFGLNFSGANSDKIKTSGKMEIDFYGGGEENKNLLMLRHAFLKVYWPNIDFSILAGQMSDVISPLFPGTINYVVGWWAGNIGYRRPQLRLTQGVKLGGNFRLDLELAAARSLGGEAAGVPSFQGRSALSLPLLSNNKTTIGISGHTGKEENDSYTWSVNLDVTLPLSNKLTLKGEYWQGENLDAYMGGIGQGVKGPPLAPVEIISHGGWATLSLGPLNNWQVTIGSSLDDPNDQDLGNGDRTRNVCLFGNILYHLNQVVQLGLEVSHWATKYKNQEENKSLRWQGALIYEF